MKLVKQLFELKMSRSMAEGRRLITQGAVLVGGCINGCNPRRCCANEVEHKRLGLKCEVPVSEQFKCTCNNWVKITDPDLNILPGRVIRIKDGGMRLLKRMDGDQGFDQAPGIGWAL